MRHGIEELELDVYLESGFNRPPGMYNCNTLQVLTLNPQEIHPVRKNVGRRWGPAYSYRHFNNPTSAGLPSVHTLSLTNVYLKYASDLFSGGKFPLLRNLCLKTCSGMHDLNINCPGLEILKLEDLELQALGVSGFGLLELEVKNCFQKYAFRWAKILAPSLQSLRWRSSITTVQFATESFRDLNTCSLYFPFGIQNAATLENTSTFLSALCFARSLAVGSRVLESWKDYWKYQFQNLKLIELHLKVARIDVQDTKMHYNALNLVKLLLGPGQALQEMTLTLRNNPVVPPPQQRRIRS